MRIGVNPEKNKNNKNILKPHRVVIVFYIPILEEHYYKQLDKVLDKCLESLVNTINFETTSITLINNNSSKSADVIVKKYSEFLDKYVFYSENKGKVYAILNEVKGIFEEFVTISDADILFFSGWENEVFNCFNSIPQTGVVSPFPVPHCAFEANDYVFGSFSIIKYASELSRMDKILLRRSLNHRILDRNNVNYSNFDKKQILIEVKDKKYFIGSTHCVATYRTTIFHKQTSSFPLYKFKNGYEREFIDVLAMKRGFFKLSVLNSFAYHIGNNLDLVTDKIVYDSSKIIDKSLFESAKSYNLDLLPLIYLKRLFGRFLIKYFWNRK
jgi:hypothetical protein